MKTDYNIKKILLLILSTILLINTSYSQASKTKIRGKITDANTGEPLAFVNIAFKGTVTGTVTDFEGNYFIDTKTPSDTLIVSYLGYFPQYFSVRKETFQTIDVKLIPEDFQLSEVVVKAGENPAHRIFREMVKNKKQNNPKRIENYQYEAYSKIEFDVSNVDEDYKKKRVFKQFQFIFDYIDTSVVTGKSYLPVFISETLSDVYYQGRPYRFKEKIKANNISGVDNKSIAQYTGQMYIDNNIYNNFLTIFGKEFISPIADFGMLTYKYYLLDSMYIDNKWCYLMTFKPKRKQELTFSGEMWVNDSTFAVKRIKARISDDANINFVNDLVVTLDYNHIDNEYWFLTKDEVFIDFNIAEKANGFFGRKTTSFKDIVINPDLGPDFFVNTSPEQTITMDDAQEKDKEFWDQARHEKLSAKEQEIYNMVDSIKSVPLFNTVIDGIILFTTGYYVHKNFEFGPYYTFSSFNEVEGYRVKLGGRTSNEFSKNVMHYGHLAYGFKDQKLKYGLGTMYMFSKEPRMSGGLSYKHDIEQLGQSSNAFMEDNILSSMLKRNPKYKLSIVDEYKAFFEKEWFEGFSNKITLLHKRIHTSDSIRFEEIQTNSLKEHLTTAEVNINTRFAYNEKFLSGEFIRTSLGSKYPIVSVDVTFGIKDIIGSEYDYIKANIDYSHKFNIRPFGTFQYKFQVGKIWGALPYPLLRLHEGNETYAFDDFSFNMMNYYEFVSDQYASVYAEHHFQGFFLNKIPLFRRLKWREVIYAKGLIGSLSDENKPTAESEQLKFPSTLTVDFNKPYYEGGIGIENIFKIFRVDAVWRFSYLDHPDIQKWGIRAKLQFIF